MSYIPTSGSGILFDPERLSEDERRIEFRIRAIDATQPDACVKLADCWIREERGTLDRPERMHAEGLVPKDEVNICEGKLETINNEIFKMTNNPNRDILPSLSLKAYHICARLVRLSINFPDHEVVCERLLQRCQELVGKLMSMHSDNLNPSFRLAARTSLPNSQTDDPVGKGAIPKNKKGTKAKRVDQRRIHVSSPLRSNTAFSSTSNPVSDASPRNNCGLGHGLVDSYVPPARRPNESLNFPNRISQRKHPENVPLEREFHEVQNVFPPQPISQYVYHKPKSMDTWKLKFDGSARDLPVDEFVFRVETMARSTGTSLPAIVAGIQFLLSGKAAAWYWIHIRKYPQQSWVEFKRALTARFYVEETDAEIRMVVEGRKQGNRESFGDFSLAIQQLLVRLRRPVSEEETVDILRRNMSHNLREALLLHKTRSVDYLHDLCRRFEKLWSYQVPVRNELRRIHEVELVEDVVQAAGQQAFPNAEVDELGVPQDVYVICWNCKEMGHTFKECQSVVRAIFCYGCGAPDIYKPTCPRCAGNGQRKPGGVGPRVPVAIANQERNQMRQPNPFRRR